MPGDLRPPGSEEDVAEKLDEYLEKWEKTFEADEKHRAEDEEAYHGHAHRPSTSNGKTAEVHVLTTPAKGLTISKDLAKPFFVPPSHFYELPERKEKRLRALYKQLDIDGDGKIDIKDLTGALETQMPHVPYAKKSAKVNTEGDHGWSVILMCLQRCKAAETHRHN